MTNCYICNTNTEEKEIEYNNPKWGDSSVKVQEKAMAKVCPKCGEIVFNSNELKRLIQLSKTY